MKTMQQTTIPALAVGALAVPTSAAVIQTSVFTEGTDTAYGTNALDNDLINEGAPTLLSFTSSVPEEVWPESGVHDGSATGGGASGDYSYWDAPSSVTLTFELTGSATGYDITSINTIYGYVAGNRHAAQNYSVYFATVAQPDYTLFHTVDYDPSTAPNNVEVSSQVTLTDSTGVLASGVTGVRFIAVDDADGDFTEVGVIQELDVVGNPTVPEPASMALLAASGLLLMRRRRRY